MTDKKRPDSGKKLFEELPVSGLADRLSNMSGQSAQDKERAGEEMRDIFEGVIQEQKPEQAHEDESLMVDENGFAEKDGIRYGTVEAWAQTLNVTSMQIIHRLKKAKKESVKARDINGSMKMLYSELDVLMACADLLKK